MFVGVFVLDSDGVVNVVIFCLCLNYVFKEYAK